MANVQLAVAGDDTTQVILSVPGVQGPAGSNLPPSGATHQLLYKQSSTDYDTAWKLITNDNVDASAAIAGTKISPNFGSQNAVTTGTNTAASFIPTSSGVPANGLYLPSANNVAISTNGTQRINIENDGDLILGTSTNYAFVRPWEATTGNLIIGTDQSATGTDGSATIFRNRGSEKLRITSTGELKHIGGGTEGDPAVYFAGSAPAKSLYVQATTGYVGLGTNTPGTPLVAVFTNATVYSTTTGASNAFAAINSSATTGSFASVSLSSRNTANAGCTVNLLGISTSTNNASDFAIQQRTTGGAYRENLRITHDGKVGVGTTSPGAKFEVNGGEIYNVNGAITQYMSAGGGAAVIGTLTNTDWSLRTNNNEKARIDTSGRLLVGTASFTGEASLAIKASSAGSGTQAQLVLQRGQTNPAPDLTLGVIKFADADSTGHIGAEIAAQSDGSFSWASGDYPTRLVFSTTSSGLSSPTERMRIANDGKLTVPSVYSFTTADAANVRVTATGDLVRSTSSLKYKTDVETLEDSYADALLNCRPVWFRSLSAADNPSWGYWGFIAEEVAEIDPRLVSWKTTETTYDENGTAVQTLCDPEPEGVQYDRFVPHLLSLIKRQQQAIETLEAKVAALESA